MGPDPRPPGPPGVLTPCIPNRFLAEINGGEETARALADKAEEACRTAWRKIAEDVQKCLYERMPHESLAAEDRGLWGQQITAFFDIYTAVLPQEKYTDQLVEQLLGPADPNDPPTTWSQRHQVAQKMLAAVKSQRHFPHYSPAFADEKVPQKDTLLGTFEHVGPGDRGLADEFWAGAAQRWKVRGSRVTSSERLCAVSLVKRFAWAQHFSRLFDLNPQELRYADSATIAAANWLAAGQAIDSIEVRREYGDWSGQWLHWATPERPADHADEQAVPQVIWDAIQAKKAKQGKPPTYYAAFVFDGDKMGDHFNAARDASAYQRISATLGRFALNVIEGIVGKHRGELIYAGGDDAMCLLPTESALACAGEIDTAFRDHWRQWLPGGEPATISGGLVVAHYKEDLRFVMEQARRAEKAAKDAGRNALAVAVCRRSGEHSSAIVPWGYVDTLTRWVGGFLGGASDRWAYKLRADLAVLEQDPAMFRLELRRQLNRAEDETGRHFPPADVAADFGRYRDAGGSTADFVTLLQTASFLARGRDA